MSRRSRPKQAGAGPAILLDLIDELDELMYIRANSLFGFPCELRLLLKERRIETEINLNVARLLVDGVIKLQPMRDESHRRRLQRRLLAIG